MLHIVHLLERRSGARGRTVARALAIGSACALFAGLALALR
ncbi:hypothetical protein [Pseudoxanthomonas sp. 10H]